MSEDLFFSFKIVEVLAAPARSRVRVTKAIVICHRPRKRNALVRRRIYVVPPGEDIEIFSVSDGGLVFPAETAGHVCIQNHRRAEFVVPDSGELVVHDLASQDL